MDRRSIIKSGGLLAAASLLAPTARAAKPDIKRKPILTIAHITDVHLRPDEGVPERFEKCLNAVKKHGVDFILNGGDSIMDASYDDVKRERVIEQWNTWDRCMEVVKPYEVYSCLGNHDMWWKAPSKEDEMYGKAYVVKRLNISARYYSFTKKGWHFVILDGNNEDISLDDEQIKWLENDLQQLVPGTPVLLMSHYPILGVTPSLVGGAHSDHVKLKNLFYKHKDKVRICLSGHNHLSDNAVYNGIRYCCNGAMSGFWWGNGDKDSAGMGYYYETPPGYAILRLYEDGEVDNQYIPHGY
jgi:3',5'-cyclic-AMP phosphodiesterase